MSSRSHHSDKYRSSNHNRRPSTSSSSHRDGRSDPSENSKGRNNHRDRDSPLSFDAAYTRPRSGAHNNLSPTRDASPSGIGSSRSLNKSSYRNNQNNRPFIPSSDVSYRSDSNYSNANTNHSRPPTSTSPTPSTSSSRSRCKDSQSQNGAHSEDRKEVKSNFDSKYKSGRNFDRDEDDNMSRNKDQLLNFLGNRELPTVVPLKRNLGDVGAPPPKISKAAPYSRHTEKDDFKYVDESKKSKPFHMQAIQQSQENDSDSDCDSDEFSGCMPKERPHIALTTKEDVFVKYDFSKRVHSVEQLPIFKQRDKILDEIERNRIIIIEGSTGCGKTTQVPQFLIDYHFEKKRRCNIVVTQPRRFAATSLASRVCEERGWELGTVVGYQIGMDKKTNDLDTLVTYMTTGVFLKKLILFNSLKSWTHVIIDEVHERDLETDLLLLLIKKLLMDEGDRRKEIHTKIILMSATLNSNKFSQYFPIEKTSKADKIHGHNGEVCGTPIFKIPTSLPFNIKEFFLDDVVDENHVHQVYNQIKENESEGRASVVTELYSYVLSVISGLDKLEEDERRRERRQDYSENTTYTAGSVLVFLPGIVEMRELERKLRKENPVWDDDYRWQILLFHSTTVKENLWKVFAPPKANRRKVILATNIAESSITIPDIVYVIDFCLTKSNCIDPRTNFNSLRTCWASVSQCIQRKGRTGRVRNGQVYRMIPKRYYKELDQDTKPDMLKSSLEYVVLQIKMLDMVSSSPKDLLGVALDPPKQSGIERAVVHLKECGGLKLLTTTKPRDQFSEDRRIVQNYDPCDGDLTFLGRIMANLPVTPHCCRLIMFGHCFGVLNEAIIIAAGLSSSRNPFSYPQDKQLEAYLQKLKWAPEFYSDCFTFLQAFKDWQIIHSKQQEPKGNAEVQWANARFIQITQMKEIQDLIDDIQKRLEEEKVIPNPISKVVSSVNEEHVKIPKKTGIMLKLAIAGAFYPNYFIPTNQTDERELSKQVDAMDLFSTVYYSRFPKDRLGELYSKTISDMVAYSQNFPRIKFSGQNVLVNFQNSAKKFGPIPEDLYRLVKMRLIRKNLQLDLLRQSDERDEMEKLIRARRKQRKNILFSPPQVKLPSIEVGRINVFVTNVDSPSRFWVIETGMHPIRNEIHELINSNLLQIPIHKNSSKVIVNALVLTMFHNRYVRGRIDCVNRPLDVALVYLIDYGLSKWTPINHLQHFAPALCMENRTVSNGFTATNHPGMAIECRLSNTIPSKIYGSIWADDAIKKFKTLEANSKSLNSSGFELKIYAIYKSVIIGELIGYEKPDNSDRPIRCNFNAVMKKAGFAENVEEPFVVKNGNRSARERIRLMGNDPRQIEACNSEQIAEPLDMDFFDSPTYGDILCKLEGPYSPLELTFRSLCQSTQRKKVVVDHPSVNSVCFEYQPTAPTSKLLVACSVNIQQNTDNLVARDTTVMPGIPGFLALASLLFAPKVELRTDPDGTRYTGAICGLGVDPTEKEVVYQDHDLEVIFDAEINNQDIDEINILRWNMSIILRKNEGENTNSAQQELRSGLLKLLSKPRKQLKQKEQYGPRISYTWGGIRDSSLVRPPQENYPLEPQDIFELHSGVHLKEPGEIKVEHLNWNYGC